MNCKKCGNPLPENENFCKICDTVQDESLGMTATEPSGFYKFITYFFLPVVILCSLFCAVVYSFGLLRLFDYTSTAYAEWGSTYDNVPFLKILDIPMGLGYLGLAAFGITAMAFLLLRKKNAPSCFFSMYLTTLIVNLAFSFIDFAVRMSIGEQTDYTAPSGYFFFTVLILWIVAQSVFLWICNRCFKKDKTFFDQ